MKILQRGLMPGEKTYRTVCRSCMSHIEFEQREAEIVRDQRDGDYVTVKCPVCDKPINCAL